MISTMKILSHQPDATFNPNSESLCRRRRSGNLIHNSSHPNPSPNDGSMRNPVAVDVAQYAEVRLPELLVLEEASSALVESKRNLRRRTASTRPRCRAATAAAAAAGHKSKAKLRTRTLEIKDAVRGSGIGWVGNDGVIEEKEKGLQNEVEITSSSCRASRRRPALLLQERSVHSLGCKPRWLETHIWHAKRMVMHERWGVMLPVRSQRGKLATIKAATRHALLQDISYMRTIELIGSQNDICSVLYSALFDGNSTPFPSWTEAQLSGISVATLLSKFCPISAMWSPCSNCTKKLWLWCHPAASFKILSSLNASAAAFTAGNSNAITAADISTQPVLVVSVPLVRLRIRGKHSHDIARGVFVQFSGRGNSQEDSSNRLLWSKVKWREGSILGLNLLDPREITPSQNHATKLSPEAIGAGVSLGEVVSSEMDMEATTSFSEGLRTVPMSDLWDEGKRRDATSAIQSFPDHVLNDLRRRKTVDAWYNYQDGKSKKVASSSSLSSRPQQQYCPLSVPSILVCLGDKDTLGGGWDVVLPKGWARPFWGGLLFAGGRASALNDLERLHLELEEPSFPKDFPDTPAGQNYWKDEQYQEGGVGEEGRKGRRSAALDSESDAFAIPEGNKFRLARIELDCGVVTSGAKVYMAEKEYRIVRATALATGGKVWKGVMASPINPAPPGYSIAASANWHPHCIGWVTSGGFSTLRGKGIALAVCNQDALLCSGHSANVASVEQESHSSCAVSNRIRTTAAAVITENSISVDTNSLHEGEAIDGKAPESSGDMVVLLSKDAKRYYPGVLRLLEPTYYPCG